MVLTHVRACKERWWAPGSLRRQLNGMTDAGSSDVEEHGNGRLLFRFWAWPHRPGDVSCGTFRRRQPRPHWRDWIMPANSLGLLRHPGVIAMNFWRDPVDTYFMFATEACVSCSAAVPSSRADAMGS